MPVMHEVTGRWKLGLALSFTTALMWGVLPIALKLTLARMDAVTVTWYRFLVAAILVGLILQRRRSLPVLSRLDRRGWLLMLVVVVGLCGNYVLYLLGLDFVTPGTAQVVIQLAPMLLLLGALVLFRESFSALQWLGLAIFVAGLALFFNRRLVALLRGDAAESVGLAMIVLAAVVWAAYALAQKQLLKVMSSGNVLFCAYVAAVVVFLPGSSPSQVFDLDALTLGMLAFASLNTVIAYGAFAEALNHWEASRVSAVVALAPLMTFAAMIALAAVFPGFSIEEPLDGLKVIGATSVVTGSMLAALGGRPSRTAAPAGDEGPV